MIETEKQLKPQCSIVNIMFIKKYIWLEIKHTLLIILTVNDGGLKQKIKNTNFLTEILVAEMLPVMQYLSSLTLYKLDKVRTLMTGTSTGTRQLERVQPPLTHPSCLVVERWW